MALDRQKVLDVARSQVGYLEKASASQLDSMIGNAGSGNYTKYSRDLAAVSYFNGRKQGVAWCAVFVAWCFYQAYGKENALRLLCQPTDAKNNAGAGCGSALKYFRQKGALMDEPQPGDMIFFYSSDKRTIAHTGIVCKVSGGRVYTIEGNTSSGSGIVPNGGGVHEKSYPLASERIAGYGRPDYSAAEGEEQEQEEPQEPALEDAYTAYTVKKGDSLWKIAKRFLGSGAKYPRLQKVNGLKGILVRAGQTLKIPKG